MSKRKTTLGKLAGLFLALLPLLAVPAMARDVAFVEPGNGAAATDEAFKIEPKSEIDIGDAIINIVRRETFFFVNQTSAPIKVEKVSVSSDSTVTATITNDDCSKQGTLLPLSRCAIEVSVTPTGPGGWSIELLMTHDGPGRITRAKIDGKTSGGDATDKHERGLFLSSKDVKPIDFGEVTANDGKIVRSALMVNDSPAPITIYSVDVVEAEKSMQRLDTGCTPDMELKPGESCPVTLVWQPTSKEVVSTDLIIRHSGQLGFAVIPVRGVAKGDDNGDGKEQSKGGKGDIPMPKSPSQSEVENDVKGAISGSKHSSESGSSSGSAAGKVHLIGTIGERALLLKPDGDTVVVQVGDQVDLGGDVPARVLQIVSTSAELLIDGKKKDLPLEAVQELKEKALKEESKDSKKNDSGGNGASGTGGKDNPAGGGFSSGPPPVASNGNPNNGNLGLGGPINNNVGGGLGYGGGK